MKQNKETKQVILSIDQATKSGYSLYKNKKIYKGGIIDMNKDKDHQFKYLYDTLTDLIQQHQVTEIVAEDTYDSGRIKAIRKLGEIRGAIRGIAIANHLPKPTFIEPTKHKAFITHNRFAKKDEVMKKLSQLGYTFEDDNQADSIAIMLYYLNLKGLPVIHPKDIVKRI